MYKSLGPEFNAAKEAIKNALDANPHVPVVIRHPQLLRVDPPEMIATGSPYQALAYSQEWAPLWYFSVLPMLMLCVAFDTHPGLAAQDDSNTFELVELLDRLAAQEGAPWWNAIDGAAE
jgi:hypothetical protein